MDRVERAEGSHYTSAMRKSEGVERHVAGEYGGSGRHAVQVIPDDAFPVRVSGARTISIARYEFARIGFSVEVYARPDTRDIAYEYAREIVDEIPEREEAALRKQEREDKVVDGVEVPDGVWARKITVEYGMTMSLAKFESAKVDVGVTEPISDDDTIEAAISRAQEWVLNRVDTKIKRLRGGDQKADVGF